jgi:hypothetical protein
MQGAREFPQRFFPFRWGFRGHTVLSLANRLDGYGVFQLLPNRLVRRDPAAPLTNLFKLSKLVLIRGDRIAAV